MRSRYCNLCDYSSHRCHSRQSEASRWASHHWSSIQTKTILEVMSVAFRTHGHLHQVERDGPRVDPQLDPRGVWCELEQSSTTISVVEGNSTV